MYLIVGGGDVSSQRLLHYLQAAELIIAADSGADHILVLGGMPDVFIGDMDSVTQQTRIKCGSSLKCEVIEYNSDKDKTDGQLALEYALTHGAKEIIFCGALGNRIDHTLGNIFCSSEIQKQGVDIALEDNHQEILFVTDYLQIDQWPKGDTVSILSLEQKTSVKQITGFKYPLLNMDLKRGTSLGISNVIAAGSVTVSVADGLAMVIRQFDKESVDQ